MEAACPARELATQTVVIDSRFALERIAATQPRGSNRMGRLALMTLTLFGLFFFWMLPDRSQPDAPTAVAGVLAWMLLLGFVFSGWRSARQHQRLRRELERVGWHVQLREWAKAVPKLEGILSKPMSSNLDRGQALLLLAEVAGHQGQYDAEQDIYEAMVEQPIGDALQQQQAQVGLAAAKLRTGELTDAVQLLGRLERMPMPMSLRAGLLLVRLYQQVMMGHSEDAVKDLEERRRLLRRHTSTHAGYGYALLAAALHTLGRGDEAASLWADATTLIAPDRLTESFDLLKPLAAAYPAVEHPL